MVRRSKAPGAHMPTPHRPAVPDASRPASRPRGQTSGAFGPAWLAAQLASLLPDFPDVTLCVALSGGADSTALLAALASTHPREFKLRALHVDHGIRPASKQWAAHCRALARRFRVPLKVLTTKVERSRGVSLEAAAREARYQLLSNELHPGEVLLTAHHADDQLETVLLQLLRGSGLPGISAMPALASFACGLLARPLLARSRAELETWVREQGLTWIEDDSNADESLDRNYLRLRVLPLIRDRWPGSATAVSRSARHVAEAQAILDTLARSDVARASYGESLSIKSLRALPPARRRNALRFWITRAGYLAPDSRRLEEIAGPLLDARPDANPFVEWRGGEGAPARTGDNTDPPRRTLLAVLPRGAADVDSRRRTRTMPPRSRPAGADTPRTGARAQRDGDLLSLHPASRRDVIGESPRQHASPAMPTGDPSGAATTPMRSEPASSADTTSPLTAAVVWRWRESAVCELPDKLGKLELEPDPRGPVDLDALPDPLTIRWRRGGERLTPRPGGPRRALKNLLQEIHVPVAERARLPLLFSDGKLLAVADLLLDATAQATPTARRRARLRWKKSSH
jgi:tRNA(Ile)-lysidine synthetase-like protein